MRDFGYFDILQTVFADCSLVSTELMEGAGQVVNAATSIGGRFVEAHPVAELVNQEHEWVPGRLVFAHHLLKRERCEPDFYRNLNPTAKFCYHRIPREVTLWQGGDPDSPSDTDAMASAQLVLANMLYPHLHPKLGWIDELGDNLPRPNSVQKMELKHVFWANFYGPAYVEKLGREFLLNAPGWKKEELDDGGILYVITESYHQWWTAPANGVLQYFRDQLPKIRIYRAKDSAKDGDIF